MILLKYLRQHLRMRRQWKTYVRFFPIFVIFSVIVFFITHSFNTHRSSINLFKMHSHTAKTLSIASVVSGIQQFHAVRRLVGSIHVWQPNVKMLLYTYRITPSMVNEMKLWRHVHVVEIHGQLDTIEPLIKHALSIEECVVFIDAHMILSAPLYDLGELLYNNHEVFFMIPSTQHSIMDRVTTKSTESFHPDAFGFHRHRASSFSSWFSRKQPSMIDMNNDASDVVLLHTALNLLDSNKIHGDSVYNEIDLMEIIYPWKRKLNEQYVVTRGALHSFLKTMHLLSSRQIFSNDIVEYMKNAVTEANMNDIEKQIGKIISTHEYEVFEGDDEPFKRINDPLHGETTVIIVRVLADNEIMELYVDGEELTLLAKHAGDYLIGDSIEVNVTGHNHVVAMEVSDSGGDVGVMVEVVQKGTNGNDEVLLVKTGDAETSLKHIKFRTTSPQNAFLGEWGDVEYDDSGWTDSADVDPNCKVPKLIGRANTVSKHGATHVWEGGCRESSFSRGWIRVHFTTMTTTTTMTTDIPKPKVHHVSSGDGAGIRRIVLSRSIHVNNDIHSTSSFGIHRQTQHLHYDEPLYMYLKEEDDTTTTLLAYNGTMNRLYTLNGSSSSSSLTMSFKLQPREFDVNNQWIRHDKLVSIGILRNVPMVLNNDGISYGFNTPSSETLWFYIDIKSCTYAKPFIHHMCDVIFVMNDRGLYLHYDDELGVFEYVEDKNDATVFTLMKAIDYSDYVIYGNEEYIKSFDNNDDDHDHEKIHHNVKPWKARTDKDGIIKIGMLVSMIKNGNSVDKCHFFTYFMPSFLKTIKKNSLFKYVVYIGVDVGDQMFDTIKGRKRLYEVFNELVVGFPNVELQVHSFKTPKSSPVHIWNNVADKAYHDGADYLYQLNDDTTFVDDGWSELFVQMLRKQDDLGVTGPVEAKLQATAPRGLIPQAFVSRRHLEIFPTFYPSVFRNWWSDDWLTQVYGNRTQRTDKRIRNENPGGTRYEIDWKVEKLLRTQVKQGQLLIHKYLKQQ